MSDASVTLLPVSDLSTLIQKHDVTASEVTEAHLRQIEKHDGQILSYVTVLSDRQGALMDEM